MGLHVSSPSRVGRRRSTDHRVAELLDPNERAVLVLHPHWWRLVGATFGGLVGLFIAINLAALGSVPLLGEVSAVVVVASLLWVVVGVARWYFEVLVLTDRRVVFSRGVIARRTSEIPLKHVNDVQTEQGILGRLLNFGRVRIESGNARGEELVTFIPQPERIRRVLSELSDRSGATETGTVPSVGASGGAMREFVSQLERLTLLRMQGMLSEEEFQRAKAKLLAHEQGSHEEEGP